MRVVDLFCGGGGLSLGAHQAGFAVAAAIDNDPILVSSYAYNFPDAKLVLEDVTTLDGEAVRAAAGGQVHAIVGGPPCQGFSAIGRRNPDDPRRRLLDDFFRIVREVRPVFFVMENVLGLGYANARGILDEALRHTEGYGTLGPVVWNAAEFGAATNRARLFVVGIHADYGDPLKAEDLDVLKRPAASVRAAIVDLENASALADEEDGFDTWRITRVGRPTEYARALRSADGRFTGHRKTRHSESVARRFAGVPAGGVDRIGRHPRLSWSGQSPAIRAGTGADRGSYQAVRPIHPQHPRVITVREAARLQGFPDRHRFHPTIWHSFRMIGNSVSPIMARAIFQGISNSLGQSSRQGQSAE